MNNYMEYDDGLMPGGRRPRLYLVKGDQVHKFTGKTISGVVLVLTERFTLNGKWSKTRYTMETAPGVRVLKFLSPMHGIWGQEFASWTEVAAHLELPMEVTKKIVTHEYKKTANRLDKISEYRAAQAAEEAQ